MSRKLMVMMLAIGLVIGLVGGFFGGYFYKNFTAEEITPPLSDGGAGDSGEPGTGGGVIVPLPDYVLDIDINYILDGRQNVKITTKNIGKRDADSYSKTKIYYETLEGKISHGATILYFGVKPLKKGGTSVDNMQLPCPNTNYSYVIWGLADIWTDITESDEENNRAGLGFDCS